MTTAFPSLTARDRERLAAKGVNPDRSLFKLLSSLNGTKRAKELMLAETDRTPIAGLDDFDLTDREMEILTLYAEGWQEKDIVAELRLSRHTVYGHMKNARHRMGARTIAHAVHLAHQNGML